MASEFAIRHAAHLIHNGGVIIYPTETVYGLGCDPLNPEAVRHLNALKSRVATKGLILLGSNLEQFTKFIAPLSSSDKKKLKHTDKPTSWIVPAKKTAPDWLTGDNQTLAIRICKHPIVEDLCARLERPLVSTSANPSGQKPALDALKLHQYFHNKVDAILLSDHQQQGQPSTLRWLHNDKIARS